ncbi:polysaccharide lyase family 14 protein [Lentinula aciculospora]|uniref:Polysaccharide lyase family 14 protein n=1 Tax=Lentinula aciculospora TaxID=153920 RepID=A0A9W9DWY0_9AGAR|nr:polysaccharide lyase family 14 protein [Lentinula aciculospora]
MSYCLLNHLVPIPHFQYGFTTNTSISSTSLAIVDLADKALGVPKISSRTSHPLVSPPNPSSLSALDSNYDCLPSPTLAWEAFYPKGSINPSAEIPGGFGFYLDGPKTFSDGLHDYPNGAGANEIVMSYRMMLESNWEWVKGGKLPGVFGGVGDLAYGCSGGRKNNRESCFDVRLMWRSKGAGELYIYLPFTERNRERLLAVPPLSFENAEYGFSVGRGAFSFPIGQWTSIAIRVKLNTVGSEDGEIELWIDGRPVISITSLTLRHSEKSKLKGMHFQTFFGGSKANWASPNDQRAWFADVTRVIVC